MKRHLTELLGRWDFLALALLAIVCGAVWGFVELAEELREGELERFDLRLLHLFRDPANPANPVGGRVVQELVRDATALGGILFLALLVTATVAVLWVEKHRRAAVWLSTATLGALALSTLFKSLYSRGRPDVIASELLPSSYSFPSGHSMLSAAVYLTVAALLIQVVPKKRTRALILMVALLLTFLTGFSRVYLGMHYPSDVLAGWTLGLAWAALCWLVAWYTRARL
jgi:undecaprenyl-diphosphatase